MELYGWESGGGEAGISELSLFVRLYPSLLSYEFMVSSDNRKVNGPEVLCCLEISEEERSVNHCSS